jgi:hypothetical protein
MTIQLLKTRALQSNSHRSSRDQGQLTEYKSNDLSTEIFDITSELVPHATLPGLIRVTRLHLEGNEETVSTAGGEGEDINSSEHSRLLVFGTLLVGYTVRCFEWRVVRPRPHLCSASMAVRAADDKMHPFWTLHIGLSNNL